MPPVPEFTGVRPRRTHPLDDTDRLHRLVAVFSHLGIARPVSRRSSTIQRSGNRRANCSMTRRSFSHRIVAEKLLTARGVFGFWPANSLGDDVEIYATNRDAKRAATFHFLRQQMQKPADQFNHCLADYIAPKSVRTASIISAASPSPPGLARTNWRRNSRSEHDDYNAS